jgi:hypothetical protein
MRTKNEPIMVMICEHDTDDPFRSTGAIIMEQYARISPEEVMERAKNFADSGKYGRVWIAKLTDITTIPKKFLIGSGPVENSGIE